MSGFVSILRKYGRPMSVYRGKDRRDGLALVQPLMDKDPQHVPSPLGRVRQDRFLCLAAPDLPLDGLKSEDYALSDGVRYNVVTTQTVAVGGKTLYQWAVLKRREDEA